MELQLPEVREIVALPNQELLPLLFDIVAVSVGGVGEIAVAIPSSKPSQ